MPKTGGTKSILIGECTIMAEMPFGRRMFRPRRRMVMRAPVVSYKHQRQTDVTYIGTNANQVITFYTGSAPGATAGVGTVPAGNKVFSLDISVNFVQTSSSGNSRIEWCIVHLRADQDFDTLFASPGGCNWSNIGLSLGRNQILKSFIGLVGSEDAGAQRWNLHVKIPKMWHRVREGDKLLCIFNAENAGALTIGTRFKSFS